MISRLKGALLSNDLSSIELETAGGVVYEVEIPLTVAERLPREGSQVELRTMQVVREDSVALYGFLDAGERELFKRLMTTSGVGAKLALSMLSTFSAPRLARALAERDVTALTQVSGIGRKTAERLALELSEKVEDLVLAKLAGDVSTPTAQTALRALMNLGYSHTAADEAIRRALADDPDLSTEDLIRQALAKP